MHGDEGKSCPLLIQGMDGGCQYLLPGARLSFEQHSDVADAGRLLRLPKHRHQLGGAGNKSKFTKNTAYGFVILWIDHAYPPT